MDSSCWPQPHRDHGAPNVYKSLWQTSWFTGSPKTGVVRSVTDVDRPPSCPGCTWSSLLRTAQLVSSCEPSLWWFSDKACLKMSSSAVKAALLSRFVCCAHTVWFPCFPFTLALKPAEPTSAHLPAAGPSLAVPAGHCDPEPGLDLLLTGRVNVMEEEVEEENSVCLFSVRFMKEKAPWFMGSSF